MERCHSDHRDGAGFGYMGSSHRLTARFTDVVISHQPGEDAPVRARRPAASVVAKAHFALKNASFSLLRSYSFFSCLPASNTLPTEESMDVLWQSINLFDLPSVILYSMYRKEEYKFWHLLFLFTSKYKSSLLFFINLGSIPLGVAAVFFFLWWILPYGKMPVAALQHMIRDSEEKTQNPLR